jgi:hypothetical protein
MPRKRSRHAALEADNFPVADPLAKLADQMIGPVVHERHRLAVHTERAARLGTGHQYNVDVAFQGHNTDDDQVPLVSSPARPRSVTARLPPLQCGRRPQLWPRRPPNDHDCCSSRPIMTQSGDITGGAGREAVQPVKADVSPRWHSLPIVPVAGRAQRSCLANEWPTRDKWHDRRTWRSCHLPGTSLSGWPDLNRRPLRPEGRTRHRPAVSPYS